MTNLTQITNNINIVPARLEADHYQIQSFKDQNKIYNLTFNYDQKYWQCNCPDATINKNRNCKHVILLKSYIHKKKQEQAPAAEHHSNSAELVQILTRISKLEQLQECADREHLLLQKDLEEHEFQIKTRYEQEQLHRQQIIELQNKYHASETEREDLELKLKQQQITINRQSQQIEALIELVNKQAETIELNRQNHYAVMIETSKLVEQQQRQIETWELMLKRVHRETEDMIKAEHEIFIRITEDQAQQIDKLTEQFSSQKKTNEQVVRVVVEAPARSSKRETDEPKAMEIQEVRNDQGKLVACHIGKFNVKVLGNCAASCDCSIGIMDRQCPHMVKVDQILSK